MWMTKQEQKIAKKLRANWVKLRPGGQMEVCMGGSACGCQPREDPQVPKAPRTGPAGRPRTGSPGVATDAFGRRRS